MHTILKHFSHITGIEPPRKEVCTITPDSAYLSLKVTHSKGERTFTFQDPIIYDIVLNILNRFRYDYIRYQKSAAKDYFAPIFYGLYHGTQEGIQKYTQYIDQTMDPFQPLFRHIFHTITTPQYPEAIYDVLTKQYERRRAKIDAKQALLATLVHTHHDELRQKVANYCIAHTPLLWCDPEIATLFPGHEQLLTKVERVYHTAPRLVAERHALPYLKQIHCDKSISFFELKSLLNKEDMDHQEMESLLKTLVVNSFKFYHFKDEHNRQFFTLYLTKISEHERQQWWSLQTTKQKQQWLDMCAQKNYPIIKNLLYQLVPDEMSKWDVFHQSIKAMKSIDPSMATKIYHDYRDRIDDYQSQLITETHLFMS